MNGISNKCGLFKLDVIYLLWRATPALAAVLLTSPASSTVQQRAADGPKPCEVTVKKSTAEAIRAEAEEAKESAAKSASLVTDTVLSGYVRRVACTVSPERCENASIFIMDRPEWNAVMAPNGYAEIWTGLLLRVESEAELAFVVARLISHVEHCHSYRAYEEAGGTSALKIGLGLAAKTVMSADTRLTDNMRGTVALGNIAIAGAAEELSYLALLARMFDYTKEQQIEADSAGQDLVVRAGYDVLAASGLWHRMVDEADASDSWEVGGNGVYESVFSNYPITVARAEALAERAVAYPPHSPDPDRDQARSDYRSIIRFSLGRWLRADIERQDYSRSLHVIARLREMGEDLGLLSFYRGEVFRLRRLPDGDLARAADAYEESVGYPDAPAEAWREVGTSRMRNGEHAAAAEAFRKYLEAAPNAPDRALVELDLKSVTAKPPKGMK